MGITAEAATRAATETTTVTITALDVRAVMRLVTQETQALLRNASAVLRDFDADSALTDCSVFTLNDAIAAVRLEFHCGPALVRRYRYAIADKPLASAGPPPENPPVGSFPPGCRVRLTVEPNPNQPAEYCSEWFRRLGWREAPELEVPEGARSETYGAFVSGGFSVERQLLADPRYGPPVSSGSDVAQPGRA